LEPDHKWDSDPELLILWWSDLDYAKDPETRKVWVVRVHSCMSHHHSVEHSAEIIHYMSWIDFSYK